MPIYGLIHHPDNDCLQDIPSRDGIPANLTKPSFDYAITDSPVRSGDFLWYKKVRYRVQAIHHEGHDHVNHGVNCWDAVLELKELGEYKDLPKAFIRLHDR